MADKNSAHHLGGDGEELRAVFPARLVLIHEPQIYFVHQSGGLQRVPGALPAESLHCAPMQFVVNQREQALQRIAVTTFAGGQPLRDIGAGDHAAA